MAESLGHDLDRDSGGEHQRRVTVAQIVQPDPAEPPALLVRQMRVFVEPNRVDQVVEQFADVTGHQRVAAGSREHQTVIPVGLAPLFLLGVLRELMQQQGTDDSVFELHRLVLATSGLRLHVEDEAAVRYAAVWALRLLAGAHLVARLHLLVHQQEPLREVEVRPAQAEDFSAPQACCGDRLEQDRQVVRRHRVQERTELVGFPRVHLGSLRLRQLDELGRIAQDQLPFDGDRQRAAQRCVDARHGGGAALVTFAEVFQQPLHMGGAQVAKLQPADARHQVNPDVVAVAVGGRVLDLAERLSFVDPLVQPGRNGGSVISHVGVGTDLIQQLVQRVLRGRLRGEPAALDLLALARDLVFSHVGDERPRPVLLRAVHPFTGGLAGLLVGQGLVLRRTRTALERGALHHPSLT